MTNLEETLRRANAASATDLDELLDLLAACPDDTAEEARQIFLKLKGKPFETIADSLRLLMETRTLGPLATEGVNDLLGLVNMVRMMNGLARRVQA